MFSHTPTKRTAPTPTLPPRPAVEPLEGRLLMAATLRGGGLVVTGTQDDDVISIAVNATNPAQLDVTLNGAVQSFDAARVKRIRVNALAGEDSVTIGSDASPVNVPAQIAGGRHDDVLSGGAAADVIRGGR